MKERYFSPTAKAFLFAAADVITLSAEIPPFDDENSGEWEDF